MSAARVATGPDDVGIVPTGVANLEAVAAAFRRLGRTPRLLDSAAGISSADYVILPGVGSFAGGMAELRRRGWAEAVRRRVTEGRPTLAICLGLQLLCEESEEAPGTAGLGCVPGRVVRLAENCRVPQLGWNRLGAPAGTTFLRSSIVYFANSYGLEAGPAGWTAAMGRHGSRFVAGKVGAGLLKRWLAEAPGAAAEFERRVERPALAAAC